MVSSYLETPRRSILVDSVEKFIPSSHPCTIKQRSREDMVELFMTPVEFGSDFTMMINFCQLPPESINF